ncbi:magnesium chelatase subunit H [Roseinatronobacter sp.]|uniref:magnesium chelatase subunit H n=1 Tax=Roseinatronobacter sp. TaxID=1945755 RepID=UPI0025F245FE|nr:magnesium chelatase subunit H [Rhodobaca sp.]
MLDSRTLQPAPYRFVVVTLDAHAAGPAERVLPRLRKDFPGLEVSIHAAAEWAENPDALSEAKAAINAADIVVANLLFIEEHVSACLPELQAASARCDAFVGVIADPQIVKLTKMGDLDMSKPATGIAKIMKKLRGGGDKTKPASGEKQMSLLRRLPKILRFIPGKAQDLRAWFLSMQYWLGGSDDNIEAMMRFLISRYAQRPEWREIKAAAPIDYPDVGLYHPDLSDRITTDLADLPRPDNAKGTIGLLLMRSYILASDTAHYDAVIRALEAQGLAVIPAFAGGLDGRPAISAYHTGKIDTLLSLTGFSLVGGPAYNDSPAAVEVLTALNVPYLVAHPLEFQTLGQWAGSGGGLGPVETTMLIALPEIDGATCPTAFAGRHGVDGCQGCPGGCMPMNEANAKAMAPCPERILALADKAARMVRLRRAEVAQRKVAIVLYGFPPNAGAVGTAAYLSVFESLYNTLHAMAREGYDLTPPECVDSLRAMVLEGNARTYGMPANVADHVSADRIVSGTPWLSEIEDVWGPAPGREQSDGRGVFVLGAKFGNVFVGVQPTFGYEGDPMRLLFEKGFAPTHAFATFYRWIREEFAADAVLHFGMHGALEFMPGKQAGVSRTCWPDRLIGNLPNIYLYAANNPSEASLAKRRSNAVTITHLTPPVAQAGLYRGLQELKDSLQRWRRVDAATEDQADLEALIAEQAAALDLSGEPAGLWLKLLEVEDALIPEGLHIMGKPMDAAARKHLLSQVDVDDVTRARMDRDLQGDHEMRGLLRALGAEFIAPVPGGDLIRSPEIVPTGRNIHAFDPFRMPTAFALREGAVQAQKLLDAHPTLPRTVAMVLWGSDNIKSDGGPMAQALALMGATPRFDAYGRLSGADLIPLAELGRPRIDVVMTLSGIFRDLLPLQTRLLAEAALKAALADEPEAQNFIRAHALAAARDLGVSLEVAALRVFSNAEGAYGSNVNQLVDSSTFGEEDELADAYQARKGFAYGVNGKPVAQPDLLKATLKTVDLAYQNLESVELGVTTVDHYFDTLGGIARAVKRARGGADTPVYIGDQTRGSGKVRTLRDQIALETRSRSLNPKFYEALLVHKAEGVRQIEAQVTNTMGWSATTGTVDPWVYQRLSETFVLDEAMRRRLAELNPQASARLAGRLIEASERNYWQPDAATLAALQDAADEIEDRVEGIAAE